MRRARLAILGAAFAAGMILPSSGASAQEVTVCVYLNLMGTEVSQCLPPQDGGVPGVPGVPGLPGLPALPI